MHGKILEWEILTNNEQFAEFFSLKYLKLQIHETIEDYLIDYRLFFSLWQMVKILPLQKFLTY